MVEIPISGLLDGDAIVDTHHIKIIEQDLVSYKVTEPLEQYHIKSQAHLESVLPGRVIPDGRKITLIFDNSITLTDGIKIGSGAVLEILGASIEVTIDTTGITEELFQHENIVNDIRALIVHDIFLKGDGTQPLCKLKGTSRVFMENCRIEGFDGMELDFPGVNLGPNFAAVNWKKGIVVKNPGTLTVFKANIRQGTSEALTFISVITTDSSKVTVKDCPESILFPADTFLFIDPNAPVGTDVQISGCSISDGDFYHTGIPEPVDAVADIGGNTQFELIDHGELSIGEYANISGMTTFPSYNGTWKVVSKPGSNSVVLEVPFVGVDTSAGMFTTKSLDSTDLRVLATGNKDQRDSMFTGEAGLEIFGSEISSVSLVTGAISALDSANWDYNKLERFGSGVGLEGELVALDSSTREYRVQYSATIEKSGGGASNIGIILYKNNNPSLEVSVNPPHTVNSGKIQISHTEIIELAQDESLQIGVKNYHNNPAIIDTSQAHIVTSKA